MSLIVCAGTHAQILQGDWVDESQAAIEKHRKTDVTVIVLDRSDRAVQGAKVSLKQDRHDFVLGLTLPSDRMPPQPFNTLPVYRCFNAIALDRYTDWSKQSPESMQVQAKQLTAWHDAIEPIRTHFGSVISADPANNQDRLSLLKPAELRDAVLARIDLAAIFDPVPSDYDLYADLLQQDMIERKLGEGMLHRMFDRAQAKRPDARFGLRVNNAISLQLGRTFTSALQKLEVRQVPFDHVSIEQPLPGPIQPNALKRMLDEYVGSLGVPVTLVSLQMGGPTQVATAIKLETLLRLAFAQPAIEGIYFAGLIDNEMVEEHAALIDNDGNPTAAGNVLDALFTTLWRSEVEDTTDERGNIEARIFTGWYTVTAQLPDGAVIQNQLYIPKAERVKLVVLQATAAEQK